MNGYSDRPAHDMTSVISRQTPLKTGEPVLASGGAGASGSDGDEAIEKAAEVMNRSYRAAIARATLGLSPATLVGAYLDWATHLAHAPGKQSWLAWKAWRKATRFAGYAAWYATAVQPPTPCIEPLPEDHRFDDPAWRGWPFDLLYQGFLLCQQWTHNATTNIRGVSDAHERIVTFANRQLLDMVAPSNFIWSNPVALTRTVEQAGANLMRGARHLLEDVTMSLTSTRPVAANPEVGVTVAVTVGMVVFRNHLFELIQYAPLTAEVRPEPVLIVPAWIMKFYILDLTAQDSLVRYLVASGFTVFLISWRNPTSDDRDLGMDSYLDDGVMAAIRAACVITGSDTLHAAGYCLGGTLLGIAAAAMARDGDARLQTLSLFAAQVDFTEAGELTLFIDSSQVALLEDVMWGQGYLDAGQMAAAFQILRSNDLIWSRAIHAYLLGERPAPTPLMQWNADATRLPARMHGQYLTQLFLHNDLAEGRYQAGGAPVAIEDIGAPIFAVGTTTDHVAPWQSVHKIHRLTNAEVTFVLTSGGHNAGIVSEPGHRNRFFAMQTRPAGGSHVDPATWLRNAAHREGSWWQAWTDWLGNRSGALGVPPPIGRNEAGYPRLEPAPGSYVRQS